MKRSYEHTSPAAEVQRDRLVAATEEPKWPDAGCRHPYPPGGPTHRCPYCFGELDLPAVRRT